MKHYQTSKRNIRRAGSDKADWASAAAQRAVYAVRRQLDNEQQHGQPKVYVLNGQLTPEGIAAGIKL